ncbi:MAG: hypothetical protein WAM14_14105 [Candidatus Nitrosopolaris sp.]
MTVWSSYNESLVTSTNVTDTPSSVADRQDSDLPVARCEVQEENETNNLAKSEVAAEEVKSLKNRKKYRETILKIYQTN